MSQYSLFLLETCIEMMCELPISDFRVNLLSKIIGQNKVNDQLIKVSCHFSHLFEQEIIHVNDLK